MSLTIKGFRALIICISWHIKKHETINSPIPPELFNALFHLSSRLALVKIKSQGSSSNDGNVVLDVNTPPAQLTFNRLANIALPIFGDRVLNPVGSPSSSSPSTSPATTILAHLSDTQSTPGGLNVDSLDSPLSSDPTQKTVHCLPTEIIISIMEYLVKSQTALFNASKTCKKWHAIATITLYTHTHLTTPVSILKFINTLTSSMIDKESSIPYYKLVRKVSFEPSFSGSLDDPTFTGHMSGIESILAAHSGLFRYLLYNRSTSTTAPFQALPNNLNAHANLQIQEAFAAPNVTATIVRQPVPVPDSIFYLLAGVSTRVTELVECGVDSPAEREQYISQFNKDPLSISGTWKPLQPSTITLSLLLRTCRRWIVGYPEWKGFGLSVEKMFVGLLFLLESLEGDFRPIWNTVRSDNVRTIRPVLLTKCRIALSSISTSLLLQVQYITSSSQRLLDSYCMIYYSATAIARLLNVPRLYEMLEEKTWVKESDELRDKIEQQPLLDTTQPGTEPASSTIPVIPAKKHKNMLAVIAIYEALSILFRRRIPNFQNSPTQVVSLPGQPIDPVDLALHPVTNTQQPLNAENQTEPQVTDTVALNNVQEQQMPPRLTLAILRDSIMTFPPTSMNGETSELITNILHLDYDVDGPFGDDLACWVRWFREIHRWHVASKQMEPVKELLRVSMGKIDFLRGIQVQKTVWK